METTPQARYKTALLKLVARRALRDRVLGDLDLRGAKLVAARRIVADRLDLDGAEAELLRAENELLDWGRHVLSRLPEYAQQRARWDTLFSAASRGAERREALIALAQLCEGPALREPVRRIALAS